MGPLGAAFAKGVMVARLRAINAARIKYVIGILHLFGRARCPALPTNSWIYAVSAEVWLD